MTADPTPGIQNDTYDAAISGYSFVEGHIPMDALHELARIVKSGGYVIYTVYDPNHCMDFMKVQGDLMKDGKLELVSMVRSPYKREWSLQFQYVYCHIVTFKVI